MSFLNQWDLQTGVFKVNGLGFSRALRALFCYWREGREITHARQHRKGDLKNTWNTQWGDYSLIAKVVPEKKHGQTPLAEEKSWVPPLPTPVHWHKHRATCRKQCRAHKDCLNCLPQAPSPCYLAGQTFLIKLASLSVQ